jgi:hypothetical protein
MGGGAAVHRDGSREELTMRWLLIVGFCGMLVVTAGCRPPAVARVERAGVAGTITLNGQPLSRGQIFFDARAGEPPVILDVVDGRYEGEVPVGATKVSIVSTRTTTMRAEVGGDGPGYDDEMEIDTLPGRYKNMDRDVEPATHNRFDFDLRFR